MEEFALTSYKIGKDIYFNVRLNHHSFKHMSNVQFILSIVPILHYRWSPTYDVSAILTSIQSLLSDPNPNSPANSMAAQLFKENRREYEKRVKACVEQSWCDD